jgi:hypothetical protein
MEAFRDSLVDCNLDDLGFTREVFMWKRGRICERLDHAVANVEWVTMHHGAVVQNLGFVRSDHRLIMLDSDYQVPVPKAFHNGVS